MHLLDVVERIMRGLDDPYPEYVGLTQLLKLSVKFELNERPQWRGDGYFADFTRYAYERSQELRLDSEIKIVRNCSETQDMFNINERQVRSASLMSGDQKPDRSESLISQIDRALSRNGDLIWASEVNAQRELRQALMAFLKFILGPVISLIRRSVHRVPKRTDN